MYLIHFMAWILILQGVISSSEHQCSRFHYEEQTLLKMLKLELFVEKMKEDIESTQQKVLETLQDLEKERSELKKIKQKYDELEQRNQADMRNYAKEIGEIREDSRRPTIIFRSRKLDDLSPTKGGILIFKQTMLNEGDGYNNSTGIFTAPVGGVYFFTVQFSVLSGKALYYDIMAENEIITRGFVYDRDSNKCYTIDALAVLKEGHRVWVKRHNSASLQESESSYWNSFSGVHLHT